MYTFAKDLIGTIYKKFKVIDYKRENGRTYLYVECPYCHTKKWIRKDHIDQSNTKSCGCQIKLFKIKDITKEKFGRLKAVRDTGKRDKNNGSCIWECSCDCGGTTEVSAKDLRDGYVQSCGCLAAENSRLNGRKAGNYIKENYCVEGTNIKNLNSQIAKNNTSGTKGVTWDKARAMWRAQITFKGKTYNLGRYSDKEEAIDARRKAEENLYKPFLED